MNSPTSAQKPFHELQQMTASCSRYARQALAADPVLQRWLQDHFSKPCNREELVRLLQQTWQDPDGETGLTRALRLLRKRVMVKLALRDLNGLADLTEVMQTMTDLAEISINQAQRCAMQTLQQQYGRPIGGASGALQELLVVGMGKLGGGELNVSSDIDLIFIYPEDGKTDGARSLDNHEFFTRLGRRIINIINETTPEGFVFRVDMRLRPYGDSGPLVMSFAALEEYLISQGREWERYAWIKARVVSPPDHPQAAELMEMVQPFVYRKYLDFGAIDSMRRLHAQIRQEVQRRDRFNNIKLGPGGIREIEFTAQVFQLIRGGQDARLRILPTRRVLQVLAESGQFTATLAIELDRAYVFLRNLEHRLQYLDDQQTQELPDKAEDGEIIARSMGHEDFSALLAELDRHREVVTGQFEQIFGRREAGADAPDHESAGQMWWRDDIAEADLDSRLQQLGYHSSSESAQRLLQLRFGNRYRQLPELSRQRVDRLVPRFVTLCARQDDPDAALSRLLILLDAICRRASYLAFLAEYPQAVQRLTRMVAASSWATDYLTQHPALLDELLDDREIYQPPDWDKVDAELQSRIEACTGDSERQLDILRHIQHEQTFHLLAMDLQGLLPLEKLSDHLSDLADLILEHVLKLAWATVRMRHRNDPRFAIIAYGKLGGRELGYASDLDLVFLYDDDHPDAQENYARLAQRINSILGSHTASGRLYETDLRLRPDGASGLMVSSVAAFAEYQASHAWMWEHQALTRARFCAGNRLIGKDFENIRREVLCQQRDLKTLRKEILDMRQKMHDGHPNTSGLFDIKHDSGGMVDIEFIVQYLVLANAHNHPQLVANIGNLALLKMAGELGLIPPELAENVRVLYRSLRETQHRLRLNNQSPCRVEAGSINIESARKLWSSLLLGGNAAVSS